MAEYTNDLRIKEIGIGEEAGNWGTTLNTQLGVLAEGFSYGVENLGSDANATITMADGASDEARSLYLKITSTSLSATRTVTLAPESVSKVWIIENATTGSQSITITQGGGQHGVTIPNGQVKMIYTTGDSESPSGAYDALDNLELGGAATAVTSVTAPLIEASTSVQTPLIEFTDGDDAITIADGGGLTFSGTATGTVLKGTTSLQTPLIEYTDGDDAITIADGGGITAANGITSTAAANTFGATSFNDADITNVGSIAVDSIVSDASPGAIQINSGGDKLRIDGTVGIGTDAHATQSLHILSSEGHIRLEHAGSPGELGFIRVLDDGYLDFWVHGDNSSDAITFRTGTGAGTVRMFIANDGDVGIGTSNPSAPLTVQSSSGAAAVDLIGRSADGISSIGFYASDGTTSQGYVQGRSDSVRVWAASSDYLSLGSNDSEAVRIDSSGRVLVGSSTGVSVTGGVRQFQIEGTSGVTAAMSIIRHQNNSGGSTISLTKSRATADGGVTIVAANDVLGEVRFTGADGVDHDAVAANIKAEVDGTPAEDDMPGRLTFWTTPDGAAAEVERMRIQKDGALRMGGSAFGNITGGATAFTLADDATKTIAATGTATAGGALMVVYETASGENALYHVGYGGLAILSQTGSNYTTSDTDGKYCVIVSGHNISFKNRIGSSKNFNIMVYGAGNFNYNL